MSARTDPRTLRPAPGEAEALEGVRLLVVRIVNRRLARMPAVVRAHAEAIHQDALVVALGAIRRYDPARGWRLTTYVGGSVERWLAQRGTAAYGSRAGVHVPAQRRGDAEIDPHVARAFARRVAPLGAGDAGVEVADRRDGDDARRAEARLDAHTLLRRLRPRERRVIVLRLGLGGLPPRTLDEIGAVLGLSRERVRQIEAAALRRLGSQRGTLSGIGARPRRLPPQRRADP